MEADEAYVIAGHKGQPEVVKQKGRKGRRRRLQGKRGRGTMEKERPPVFGMIQRGGQVVMALVGFQGRGVDEGVPPDFCHSLLLKALIFQAPSS